MASAIDPDTIVDRRRLRRRLGTWRLITFATIILALLITGFHFSGLSNFNRPHIAKIRIRGLITGSESTLNLITSLTDSEGIKGVIVDIDSPGGTTIGSERVYAALRTLSNKKPVISMIGTVGASGAYIAALGTDRIFASGNSIVGSIGVIIQYPNYGNLLEKVGVKMEEIKSSPLKAAPNGYEPTSDAARAAMASIVSDSYTWFKQLVKDRRQMSDVELAQVDDGRVYTGRQGLPLKLIDAIGNEKDAVMWMERERNLTHNLPVLEHEVTDDTTRLGLFSLAGSLAEKFNLSALAYGLRAMQVNDNEATLDGTLAIWQAN